MKYLDGIKKTGFGLEYSVSKSLSNNGWTVINNKYYIDDVQGSAREIDILAYKVTLKNDIQVYTVLIISCKKSQENVWALLSKEKNHNDPNIDWNPVALWSNQEILKLVIEHYYSWKDVYVNHSANLNEQLFSPKKHIFAFQELNKNSGKPQNDKAIFNSIVSSMKSQDYEIGSLNQRKKQESIYNFNLISVVDAPIIRINYSDTEPSIENIDSDIYIGSYIINKKETISRVHFVNSKSFDSCLATYELLHKHNTHQSSMIFNSYFIDCLKEKKKVDLFINKFNRKVRWDIYIAIKDIRSNYNGNVMDVGMHWDKHKNCLAITVDGVCENNEINMLTTNKEINSNIATALKEIYRYKGEYYFESDIPF